MVLLLFLICVIWAMVDLDRVVLWEQALKEGGQGRQ